MFVELVPEEIYNAISYDKNFDNVTALTGNIQNGFRFSAQFRRLGVVDVDILMRGDTRIAVNCKKNQKVSKMAEAYFVKLFADKVVE